RRPAAGDLPYRARGRGDGGGSARARREGVHERRAVGRVRAAGQVPGDRLAPPDEAGFRPDRRGRVDDAETRGLVTVPGAARGIASGGSVPPERRRELDQQEETVDGQEPTGDGQHQAEGEDSA